MKINPTGMQTAIIIKPTVVGVTSNLWIKK